MIRTQVCSEFADACLSAERWDSALALGDSNVVFLTWQWQTAWWRSFARGRALIIAAIDGDRLVAVAPFFTEAGMIYFIGSGGSDYLDFVGDISESSVIDALLGAAMREVADFAGFVFYHVPERSNTAARLARAADRLGLAFVSEGDLPAPALDIAGNVAGAAAATRKKSLLRHERFFVREGGVSVEHLTDAPTIAPALDDFFSQHRARWADTNTPSLFEDASQRRFYHNLTAAAGAVGWLRFTRIGWRDRVVAYHFGFHYRGQFMWYKPSFAIALARHSPGEVLLRQLILRAIDEGAHTFDFGLGDELFKQRFATRVERVRNWGLYSPVAGHRGSV